jgi:hypothetical protein
LRCSSAPQPEREVVEHRHLRIQRVVLEDHRDVALARRHTVHQRIADEHRARRHRLEPGEHPQRRRLAGAGRPHEHHELRVGDLQRQLAHGLHLAEQLPDVVEADGRHQPFTAPLNMPRMKCRCRNT